MPEHPLLGWFVLILPIAGAIGLRILAQRASSVVLGLILIGFYYPLMVLSTCAFVEMCEYDWTPNFGWILFGPFAVLIWPHIALSAIILFWSRKRGTGPA
jgi:hypothetical protein